MNSKAVKRMAMIITLSAMCVACVYWAKYKSDDSLKCKYKTEYRLVPGEPGSGLEERWEKIKRCS